jgi:hypothetical protein
LPKKSWLWSPGMPGCFIGSSQLRWLKSQRTKNQTSSEAAVAAGAATRAARSASKHASSTASPTKAGKRIDCLMPLPLLPKGCLDRSHLTYNERCHPTPIQAAVHPSNGDFFERGTGEVTSFSPSRRLVNKNLKEAGAVVLRLPARYYALTLAMVASFKYIFEKPSTLP